jgi:hypothetical protein
MTTMPPLLPPTPQLRSHGSKGYISLENGVIFQKVIGVTAVAAGLRKRVGGARQLDR